MPPKNPLPVRELQTIGFLTTINSESIRVYQTDENSDIVRATGTAAATTQDSQTGYAKGAIYSINDAATGIKSLYENIGTTSSSSFNLIGDIAAAEITLADGDMLIGNASGVAAAVTMSGDVTTTNAGVTTVTAATGAFDVGTNVTWALEVNHTSTVTASTSAATAGGDLSHAAGAGNTTGAGGNYTATAGAGGNDAVGGIASLVGGAAGGGNRAGGVASIVGGAGQGTGAGGAADITSGAGENSTGGATGGASGDVNLISGAAGTEDTGTGGASGALNLQTAAGAATSAAGGVGGKAGDINITGGAGGADSEGASGTGGEGASVIIASGAGGAGNTVGNAGVIFFRSAILSPQPAPAALTTTATITVVQLFGRIITANQGASGAATYTTPTGTQIDNALPSSLLDSDSFELSITNISTDAAEDVTLAGGTGVTIIGNAVVASNAVATDQSAGTFRFRRTGAATYDVFRIA